MKNKQKVIMYKPKTLKWFKNRIGKRIYREHSKCCPHCDEIAENGLIVANEQHASHLYSVDCDFANENIFMNYRDKK